MVPIDELGLGRSGQVLAYVLPLIIGLDWKAEVDPEVATDGSCQQTALVQNDPQA